MTHYQSSYAANDRGKVGVVRSQSTSSARYGLKRFVPNLRGFAPSSHSPTSPSPSSPSVESPSSLDSWDQRLNPSASPRSEHRLVESSSSFGDPSDLTASPSSPLELSQASEAKEHSLRLAPSLSKLSINQSPLKDDQPTSAELFRLLNARVRRPRTSSDEMSPPPLTAPAAGPSFSFQIHPTSPSNAPSFAGFDTASTVSSAVSAGSIQSSSAYSITRNSSHPNLPQLRTHRSHLAMDVPLAPPSPSPTPQISSQALAKWASVCGAFSVSDINAVLSHKSRTPNENDLYIKLLNRRLPVNQYRKFSHDAAIQDNVNSHTCPRCKTEVESLVHFLFECKVASAFWKRFNRALSLALNVELPSMRLRDIVFMFPELSMIVTDAQLHVLVVMHSVAVWTLWGSRSYPVGSEWRFFLHRLQARIDVEHGQSSQSMSLVEEFWSRWCQNSKFLVISQEAVQLHPDL
ncbi:uncharacterized protein BJ171DRAFT_173075 [Polychytrium aggregatum]|uniref:uncharacterized protein n=1 Tax=Polychytrium aggregatum TaxID=110093 RepID=UPI0022FDC1F0|nr:uncharacterized protein BJ171DRAFT_173075 [Polychytrium aggregatum]KAI9209004.1 hypothetical protein BJ171DRAFT_173075 [Polychytrium aggregatum]